jgi:hypothetical protein
MARLRLDPEFRAAERLRLRLKQRQRRLDPSFRARESALRRKGGKRYRAAKARRLRVLASVRVFLSALKSAPCSRCGGCFPPPCMDFHHRAPATKERDLSEARTLTSARREAAKCEVVCANCHRLIHTPAIT